MRTLLGMIVLAFLVGCGPTAWQQDMAYIDSRVADIKARQEAVIDFAERTATEEALFLKKLTDEQLVAYHAAATARREHVPAAIEMTDRRLREVCPSETYDYAVDLMEDTERAENEKAAIARDYERLNNEFNTAVEAEHRRQDAMSDYMLRESIRNSGRNSYGR